MGWGAIFGAGEMNLVHAMISERSYIYGDEPVVEKSDTSVGVTLLHLIRLLSVGN